MTDLEKHAVTDLISILNQEEDRESSIKPYEREVFLGRISCFPDISKVFQDDAEEIIPTLSIGELLELRRETTDERNPFDVALENADGVKVGSLLGMTTDLLANLLDAGKALFGRTISIEYAEGTWICAEIDVYLRDM
jgi:hypothetical protein